MHLVMLVLHTTTANSWVTSARLAIFQVITVISSTGFAISDFSVWPLMLPPLIIFIGFIGGCSGSTAGGMKVIRIVILARQTGIEIARLIHPHMLRSLKIGDDIISGDIVRSVWAFFGVYVFVFVVLLMFLFLRQVLVVLVLLMFPFLLQVLRLLLRQF